MLTLLYDSSYLNTWISAGGSAKRSHLYH